MYIYRLLLQTHGHLLWNIKIKAWIPGFEFQSCYFPAVRPQTRMVASSPALSHNCHPSCDLERSSSQPAFFFGDASEQKWYRPNAWHSRRVLDKDSMTVVYYPLKMICLLLIQPYWCSGFCSHTILLVSSKIMINRKPLLLLLPKCVAETGVLCLSWVSGRRDRFRKEREALWLEKSWSNKRV